MMENIASMNLRAIIRWTISLFAFIGVLLISVNVETLFTEKGANRFLTDNWEQITSNIRSPLFLVLVGIFIGGTFFMWIDYAVRNLKIKFILPDIKTSVKLQFTAGSNKITQLANSNINNTFGERALFNFYGDNNKLIAQGVIWYVFLTFNKSTHYGQIIVDAGNAKIPEYQIISQGYDSAIIRFNGDIGNVALEIKALSANQESIKSPG